MLPPPWAGAVGNFTETARRGGGHLWGSVCLLGTFSESLFAFFNKIQNYKLCKARKLKGQTLSEVHFKSEVQNVFNDIIAKGKNLFECKLLFEQGMNSQTVAQCSSLCVPGVGVGVGAQGERHRDQGEVWVLPRACTAPFASLEIILIFPLDLEPMGYGESRQGY